MKHLASSKHACAICRANTRCMMSVFFATLYGSNHESDSLQTASDASNLVSSCLGSSVFVLVITVNNMYCCALVYVPQFMQNPHLSFLATCPFSAQHNAVEYKQSALSPNPERYWGFAAGGCLVALTLAASFCRRPCNCKMQQRRHHPVNLSSIQLLT